MHPPHIGGGLGGGGCFFASFFAPKKVRNCPFLKEGVGDDGRWQGSALQKGVWGGTPETKKCFLWYESNVEIRISLEGWGISDDTDAMVQTISRGIGKDGDAAPKPGVATPYRAISGRKVLYRCLIEQKRLYLTETLLNPQ